ncbi:MAG: ABC transporter permease [Chthoniobacterales bacterium]
MQTETFKPPMSSKALTLEAGKTERHYWRDLWRYRELFTILAWRDVSVRYKQTVIGVIWAVIQPAFSIVVMTVIFGKMAGLDTPGGVPYALMVCAGMLPWQFFSNCLSTASNSLVSNASLITKVYFPRLIIPASAIVVSLIDFLITLAILFGLMAWYHFIPTWRMLTIPFFLLLAMIAALGPGLLLTAMNVKYRDVRYIIPFIIQAGTWLSPVAYNDELPLRYFHKVFGELGPFIYSLNPLVGVINGFRWAILGEAVTIYWPGFFLSIVISLILLYIGVHYFRKTERRFADTI